MGDIHGGYPPFTPLGLFWKEYWGLFGNEYCGAFCESFVGMNIVGFFVKVLWVFCESFVGFFVKVLWGFVGFL